MQQGLGIAPAVVEDFGLVTERLDFVVQGFAQEIAERWKNLGFRSIRHAFDNQADLHALRRALVIAF